MMVETSGLQIAYLINYIPPVFYAASALWYSFPTFVLLQGIIYAKTYLLFLQKKVREYDTEGTADKKNMTPYIRTSSIITIFTLVIDMYRNEKRK